MEPIKFKTINFRAGTYVYIEEQSDSGEFYIIRSGKLIEENPLNTLTGEPDLLLGAGDFFGVLDCMSRRPRISSMRVLEDTSLISIRYDQFELLIKQMAPVAMKIIRYFSHRLRKYNLAIGHLISTGKNPLDNSHSNALIKCGNFYLERGIPHLAGYAYSRYLDQNPQAADVEAIKTKITALHYDDNKYRPLKNGMQQTYEAGQPIFVENEPGYDLYIVLEGQIKITKILDNNEVLLAMIQEKDIFGEMAILENSPRSATAVATSKVTLLRINKQNFETYIQTHPEIARRIIELLSDRIWVVYKRLANQLIQEPITKIYDALQTLLQKNRIPLQKGLHYKFEMGPAEILQFVGIDEVDGKKVMENIFASDPILNVTEDDKLYSKDVYNIRSAIALSGRLTSSKNINKKEIRNRPALM